MCLPVQLMKYRENNEERGINSWLEWDLSRESTLGVKILVGSYEPQDLCASYPVFVFWLLHKPPLLKLSFPEEYQFHHLEGHRGAFSMFLD